MGVVVSEMTIETRIAVESVMANSRNKRPYNAAHQQDGDEHRHEGNADGEHREADLLRALERRRHGFHARPPGGG